MVTAAMPETGLESGPGLSEEQEKVWAAAGEKLAASNSHEKIIEEKERQLTESIQRNYHRIKEVERELAGLQLQLKLTSGPKKSALEMMRRKIEAQNDKVVAAREKYIASRKVTELAEDSLKAEEQLKERLCSELNLLVQQSAHAQLEKLEQLTQRLEALNYGMQEQDASALSRKAEQLQDAIKTMAAAQRHPGTAGPGLAGAAEASARRPSGDEGDELRPSSPAPAGGNVRRATPGRRAASPPGKADRPPLARTASGSAARAPDPEQAAQRARAEAEAEAARARHVSLTGAAGPAQQQQPAGSPTRAAGRNAAVAGGGGGGRQELPSSREAVRGSAASPARQAARPFRGFDT